MAGKSNEIQSSELSLEASGMGRVWGAGSCFSAGNHSLHPALAWSVEVGDKEEMGSQESVFLRSHSRNSGPLGLCRAALVAFPAVSLMVRWAAG